MLKLVKMSKIGKKRRINIVITFKNSIFILTSVLAVFPQ